jgi:hypothetical protein
MFLNNPKQSSTKQMLKKKKINSIYESAKINSHGTLTCVFLPRIHKIQALLNGSMTKIDGWV